ncbi:hypothetical protein [Ornithinimicrobium tianjinense]|uniref:Uncharacterized protein n=1 Tax=Ornithinimicrobium tianjinense TaxID=1195761 RepID=A0A917BHK9_9MICO|nr:hypothetical protein [Ornithinimicrobium tianjinense]GGF40236.1 hypothetical protein GCM10011366_04840 [Ornithinimicrobium tianjinense]
MNPSFVLRRWVLLVAAGEFAGFMAPALAGSLAYAAGVAGWWFYLTMVAAGAVEGLVLGAAQGTALRRAAVPASRARWTALTSVAAACAWSLGMLPSTLQGVDWRSPAVLVAVVVGAVVLLCSIPSAQWLELRRVSRRATLWLPINVVAWGVGLLWTFAPSPFVDEGTSPWVLVGVFAVAGLLMAVTMAVLTGLGLRRYVLRASRTVEAPSAATRPDCV